MVSNKDVIVESSIKTAGSLLSGAALSATTGAIGSAASSVAVQGFVAATVLPGIQAATGVAVAAPTLLGGLAAATGSVPILFTIANVAVAVTPVGAVIASAVGGCLLYKFVKIIFFQRIS
ncbi:hypothetical protein ANSO36C_47390 [Nostoc cf. commune SO-36]|uniref:Uncharacterized protein n=1 Tax=Nostoc cf. commune SO-36 TaxID=449208 RepID=A0ABN6QBU9_NOSCO|nr:hypothetical protein [Nostoc commune]BDI18937.1 hypothetical protein ANSO36C_47390 [Nostoc cf. commune SO-36]